MAEVRRRRGDGDTADVGEFPEVGAGSSASSFQPTISSSNVEKQALLEPLQLSDSATADSSDHVSAKNNELGRN